jgi:hypothetical protein
VIFGSAADLIYQTPRFYESAQKRLRVDLGGYCDYVDKYFGGENLYFTELDKNIEHARRIADKEDLSMLRRKPPNTLEPAREERLI